MENDNGVEYLRRLGEDLHIPRVMTIFTGIGFKFKLTQFSLHYFECPRKTGP